MNHMTDYLKNKVLNENLLGAYVGLFSGDNELNKASYTRQSIAFNSATEKLFNHQIEVILCN